LWPKERKRKGVGPGGVRGGGAPERGNLIPGKRGISNTGRESSRACKDKERQKMADRREKE